MKKAYTQPQFQFVKTDESNKVFFATSGTPGPDPKTQVQHCQISAIGD